MNATESDKEEVTVYNKPTKQSLRPHSAVPKLQLDNSILAEFKVKQLKS